MKKENCSKEIIDAIEQSKTTDFSGVLAYRFWFKFYYIVYPLSKWFARKKVRPNTITLLMLPSAIISALLFGTHNIYALVFGALLIHLFQIFDLCDGKVARATKQTSLLGRELDFLMHVICHPVVFLSFYGIIIQTNFNNNFGGLLIVFIGAVIEATNRSLMNLSVAISNKSEKTAPESTQGDTTKNFVLNIYDNVYRGIISFPYFMCIAPAVGIIEIIFDIQCPLFVIILVCQIIINVINILKMVVSLCKKCLSC